MKHYLKPYIGACAAGMLVVGCARTVCLKFIDASTHEPLEGVSAQWLQARHQMFQTLKQEGPTNLPPSGQDGIVRSGRLHRWWANEFIFSRPGYSNVYGFYETRKLSLADRMRYFPPGDLQDQFILDGNVTIADKSNGCFLVRMVPH